MFNTIDIYFGNFFDHIFLKKLYLYSNLIGQIKIKNVAIKTGLFSEKINSIRQHVDTRYFCPLPENIIEHIYEMHVTSLKMDLKKYI